MINRLINSLPFYTFGWKHITFLVIGIFGSLGANGNSLFSFNAIGIIRAIIITGVIQIFSTWRLHKDVWNSFTPEIQNDIKSEHRTKLIWVYIIGVIWYSGIILITASITCSFY